MDQPLAAAGGRLIGCSAVQPEGDVLRPIMAVETAPARSTRTGVESAASGISSSACFLWTTIPGPRRFWHDRFVTPGFPAAACGGPVDIFIAPNRRWIRALRIVCTPSLLPPPRRPEPRQEPPALPRAAWQKPRRDSNDCEDHHHQDGSGEHLDQVWHGSVPPVAGALFQVCTSLQRHLHQSRVAGGLGRPARSLLARLSAVGQQPALEQSEDA